MISLRLSAFQLMALSLIACGDTDPKPAESPTTEGGAGGPMMEGGAGDAPVVEPGESLLPWKTGNTWTYRVTDGNGVSDKVTTVGELERVGGMGPNRDKMAFKTVTQKRNGADRTVSWQAVVGDKVVRYREQAFHAQNPADLELEEHWDPYKIHIDSSPTEETWLEVYQETKLPVGGEPSTVQVMDRWFIDSESETVTVPAGKFDAVVFRKVGGSEKRYWYVRGVGKVKETGGQTEELVEYEVSP